MRNIFLALAAGLLIAPVAKADSEFSVVLQGGAAKYNQSLSAGSDTGVAYGARFGILPTPMLGVELGYLLATNFWVSAGYNVFGYRDADLAGADYTAKGPFVRLRYKFDETLFE